jgi:hypothetical protein
VSPLPPTSSTLPETAITKSSSASAMTLDTRCLLTFLPLPQADITRLNACTWPTQPTGATESTKNRSCAQALERSRITHESAQV